MCIQYTLDIPIYHFSGYIIPNRYLNTEYVKLLSKLGWVIPGCKQQRVLTVHHYQYHYSPVGNQSLMRILKSIRVHLAAGSTAAKIVYASTCYN